MAEHDEGCAGGGWIGVEGVDDQVGKPVAIDIAGCDRGSAGRTGGRAFERKAIAPGQRAKIDIGAKAAAAENHEAAAVTAVLAGRANDDIVESVAVHIARGIYADAGAAEGRWPA